MLTKMPKVGDVLIANEKAEIAFADVTAGKEYEVNEISVNGIALFVDDTEWASMVEPDIFDGFTLKSDGNSDEPVGFIAMASVQSAESYSVLAEDIGYYGVFLSVDSVGLASVKRLASESTAQRKRAEIQAQIDALQAELNAL